MSIGDEESFYIKIYFLIGFLYKVGTYLLKITTVLESAVFQKRLETLKIEYSIHFKALHLEY